MLPARKTGSNESFTAPPETATRRRSRFSGRGRVRRCAVRATSLPCPGNHPGTRPIGWCRRNAGPPPALQRLHPGEHFGAFVPHIAAERHMRDRPGPGVLPNPAHRHREQLGDLLSPRAGDRSRRRLQTHRSRRRGKNEGGRVARCRPALPLPQGGLRGMGAPPTFDIPIRNAGRIGCRKRRLRSNRRSEKPVGHRLQRLPQLRESSIRRFVHP